MNRATAKARIPAPSEHDEQVTVIDWWGYECKRWGLPEFTLYAIPNGGERHPAVAAKLKAEGVRPHIPDLCLIVPRGAFHGLYLEMKSETGVERPGQAEVRRYLLSAGYHAIVCHGATEAMRELDRYLRQSPT